MASSTCLRSRAMRRLPSQCSCLPAIRIEKGEYFTRASLFPLVKYTEMSKSDKVQACYQHTCLLYENGMELTNASLRMRLDMNKNNSAGASRIISDFYLLRKSLYSKSVAGSLTHFLNAHPSQRCKRAPQSSTGEVPLILRQVPAILINDSFAVRNKKKEFTPLTTPIGID